MADALVLRQGDGHEREDTHGCFGMFGIKWMLVQLVAHVCRLPFAEWN